MHLALAGTVRADDPVKQALPTTYFDLAPFAEWFESGFPILTYHKLGPRPPGVRLKGLYVGERLFDRQLAQLRNAGYRAAPLERATASPAAREIGITFDDGYVNALRYGLPSLERHGFCAIQYLVAERLGGSNDWDTPLGEAPEALMDAGQVREWIQAGQWIGSHGLTHARLTEIGAMRAREEIGASKKQLEDLFGVAVEHFCFPYGAWNEALAGCVAEAGYRTACTTQFGINAPGDNPFSLRRIQSRYRSWGLRGLRQRVLGR